MIRIGPSWRAAFTLMRIPFSVFLMPVYWFAISNTPQPILYNSIVIFIILHLFVYPASNGYNSYFDKDTGSIGGLEKPPPVNNELFNLVVIFDVLAVLLSAILISITFSILVVIYLLISKAYSFDKIRLKKFPVIGLVVVTIFQGAFIYLAVRSGVSGEITPLDFAYALVSSLFLAGSYPMTQIYQHEEDRKRGDITLSLLLGIKGTFSFAAIFIATGTVLLLILYGIEQRFTALVIFPLATLPVLLFFNKWKKEVQLDLRKANYENTMSMNKISSVWLSLAFVLITIAENFIRSSFFPT